MYHQLGPHLPFQPGDCQSKGRGQGNGTNPGSISVFLSVGHLSSRRAIGSARSVINWRQQNPRGRIRCGTEIIQHICPILSVFIFVQFFECYICPILWTLYLSYSLNIIFVQIIKFFNQTSLKLSDTTVPTATIITFSYFSQNPHGILK